MKKTNKKYLIIVLVVLLLGLAVGYAVSNNVLTISGKATAKPGEFDMAFTSDCAIIDAVGIDTAGSYATPSADGDSLKVLVKDLHYPGAGAKVHVVVKNVGTLPAKVKTVELSDSVSNRNDIMVKGLDQINTNHPTINPNETCTFDFTVQWAEGSTSVPGDLDFSVAIDYEQDTEALFVGTPTHTDA